MNQSPEQLAIVNAFVTLLSSLQDTCEAVHLMTHPFSGRRIRSDLYRYWNKVTHHTYTIRPDAPLIMKTSATVSL